MTRRHLLLAALFFAATVSARHVPAQDAPALDAPAQDAAAQPDLADLIGSRPLVVFADAPDDPAFVQQMQWIDADTGDLAERRVVVLTDTDPAANGPLRQRLRPHGFSLVMIDTDGSIAGRRPFPATVRELSNMIDRKPSRRRETGSNRP